MALQTYYPELGESKPVVDISATLSHYGRHYFLRTRLELSGRGVKLEDVNAETGVRRYKVTTNAFDAIKAKHAVGMQILLD